MKTLSLILIFIVSLILSKVYGGEVDSLIAETVAKNFYLSRLAQSNLGQKKSLTQDIEINLIHVKYADSLNGDLYKQKDPSIPLYYIFNVNDDKGFVIVSGDDRIIPVLGYAFSSTFSDEELAPAFVNWMRQYEKQIQSALATNLKGSYATRQEWNIYLGAPEIKSSTQLDEVLPLLQTTWNQGCIYNIKCPSDDDGPCNRAYVGCVAVATAQIMKYWNHPASSNKIPGYYDLHNYEDDKPIKGSDYGCLSDIEASNYPWSAMPDKLSSSSTSQESSDISALLYNTALACKMNFGPSGSGAYVPDARTALVSYFHYDQSARLKFKEEYSEVEWENLIKEELDANRPVIYTGSGTGAHAFNCDGYHGSNYFHFNWGWGGYADGYFYLPALTPASFDFSENQYALIGIIPDEPHTDPYDHIIQIEGIGQDYTQTFQEGGSGAWDISDCGYYTPGKEQVYSFTAPESGIYGIEIVSANTYVDYSWRTLECGEPGWSCIDLISTEGTYGYLSWTGGVTYHILLDDANINEGSHLFYLSYLGQPELSYEGHMIDDDNSTSSGNNNGLVEPGETIEMLVNLANNGNGDTHNVSALISTSDPDISISDDYEKFDDIPAGASEECIADFDFSVSPDCPGNKDVTFNLEITSDENTWTDQFVVHIYPPTSDPCENVIEISGYGSGYSQTFTGSHGGAWNSGYCGKDTPGIEQVYSFAAPHTGIYSIDVLSASGEVYYSWQGSSCGTTGWNCIDAVDSEGSYGNFSWTEGTIYYILLDDMISTNGSHQFFINYLGSAELGIESLEIDDDTQTGKGNSNKIAEPGENVQMLITLHNSGIFDSHNVSASLSTTDPDITIISNSDEFGDIPADGSMIGNAGFDFSVSQECSGNKEVLFTLDISSDEGLWSDQHNLYIYPVPLDPCENTTSIEGIGSEHSQTFSGGLGGAWNSGNCGSDTPGKEQVYSFTAPYTGIYSLNVVTVNGPVYYSWQATSCSEAGWICIADVDSKGSHGTMTWIGGETYYILLDDSDSSEGTHDFSVDYIGWPNLGHLGLEISDNELSGIGNNNNLIEPGETIEISFSLKNSGSFDSRNVSAAISTTDPDITFKDEVVSFGDISIGESKLCPSEFNFSVSPGCSGDKEVTFRIEISSDEGTWTDQFDLHIYPLPPAPCDNVISMDEYGSENSQVFTGGAGGAWNSGNCGINTPGTEQVYSFIAPDTGLYALVVDSANSKVYYSWQASTCAETGWNCLADVDSRVILDTFTWTGGRSYYLLLDDEDSAEGIQKFHIEYLGWPDLEYLSHKIAESEIEGTGNNTDSIEPGENIKMLITLINNGNFDSHNVSASVSTTDSDITCNEGFASFGNIPIDGQMVCGSEYNFSVSSACSGDKTITFTIDMSSDEGTWTDHFDIYIQKNSTSTLSQKNDGFSMYPNPTTGKINIQMNTFGNYELSVNSLNGKLMKNIMTQGTSFELDLSSLEKGVYFITVKSKESVNVRKLIIQ